MNIGEPVLNLGADALQERSFGLEERATDPVISPDYSQPADFTAQYPQPLDPTEIIEMCEEINLWLSLPEKRTMLNAETFREMTSLEFNSGSNYIAFQDGYCPEEYTHDGGNTTVTHKNIGAKKSLSIRDIMHSQAVAGMGAGINTLVGPFPSSEGLPGGTDAGTLGREYIANVKEKEMKLAATLVLNGWDRLLVEGNHSSRTLEFTGIENWATNYSCTFHTNDNSASGTFSGLGFDRFLSESCAKPTTLYGHPAAIQEMMAAYFQLGYQGSELVNFNTGNRIVPGYNFAGYVNTGVGKLQVIADNNFNRSAAGAVFQADIWALRMTHNGEPLVYKSTQVPFSLNDLVPGCTAISFQVWAATALIIKACCAQGQYRSQFTGRIATTCTVIG